MFLTAQAFGSISLNVLTRHQHIWQQPFVSLAFEPNKPHVLFFSFFFFKSWILRTALRPESWSHTETPQFCRREIDWCTSLCLPRRLQRKMQNGNRSHLMKHEWLKKPVGRGCQTADTTPFFFYWCHPLFIFSWGQQTEEKERGGIAPQGDRKHEGD